MRKNTVVLAAAVAASGLVLSACGGDGGAGGGEAKTMNFAHYYAEGPETAGESKLVELVNEKSEGDITINTHWAEALGGPTELPELIETGGVEMGIVAPHFIPEPFPFYRIAAMSVWSTDPIEALQEQEQVQKEVFSMDQFTEELDEHNMLALLHQPLSAYYLLGPEGDCNLDMLQGARVRSLGNDLPGMLEAVGASPVSLTTGEMYEALDRGTVDYVTIPMRHMLAYDLHEVADQACGPIMYMANGHTTAINKDVWEGLSDEQRQLFEESAEEAQATFTEEAIAEEEQFSADLEAEGLVFKNFDEADFAEWQDMVPDLIDTWAEGAVSDGADQADVDEVAEKLRGVID